MKYLLVDVDSAAFSAYPFRDMENFSTFNILTGTLLKNIRKWQSSFHCDRIIALFDGGSNLRKAYYPEYKGKRKNADDAILQFKIQIKTEYHAMKELFTAFGIAWVHIDNLEGDDLIAAVSYDTDEAVIVSKDSDMFQLITDKISVYDQVTKKLMTQEKFLEKYPYPVASYVDAKSMIGDTSDNIKGFPGIGPATVAKLYSTYKTLKYEELLEHYATLKETKVTAKLFNETVVEKFLMGRTIIDLQEMNQLIETDFVPNFNNHLKSIIKQCNTKHNTKEVKAATLKYSLYELSRLNYH